MIMILLRRHPFGYGTIKMIGRIIALLRIGEQTFLQGYRLQRPFDIPLSNFHNFIPNVKVF